MLTLFEIVFLAGLALYVFVIHGPRRHQYKRTRSEKLFSRPLDILLDFLAFAGWQVIPLVFIFSPWLDFANYHLPDCGGWIGIALFAISLWLYWSAYQALGANWTPKIEILEGQSLVTSGIYAYIRHPVYAAMWLWSIAQPLLLHNWLAGFGLLAVFIPLYILRMPREEQMMLEHFGEAYRAYMARTGRLFPRFWSKP